MVQLSNTIVPLENRGYTLKTDEIVAMAEMGNLEENGNEPLQN